MTLLVITTHPVQYHAPVYRMHSQIGIPTTVVHGSDFSIKGYIDREFGTQFAWDSDLLAGYESIFLSHAQPGAMVTDTHLSTTGLERVLQQVNPRAILLQGYRPGFELDAFFKVRKYGHPLLFRGEVTDHAHHRNFAKHLARDLFLRWYYYHFDLLLYIGNQAQQHYLRLGVPTQKLMSAPYCVDTTPFHITPIDRQQQYPEMRQKLQIIDEKIVVLYSGKLVHRKGVDLVIAAITNLPQALQQRIVLMLLGDGEMRNALQTMADHAKLDTRFIGFQNQAQLSVYYNAADMLVVPSRDNETWGLVVNEALHHGLPCVVSDKVGSAIDLIESGYNGDIFAANSVEALTQSLHKTIQLLQEPDIAERCRSMVQSHSVANAAEGIAKAYAAITHST
jgi:glycosyltransferase involved in cell wall biosynthesis